MKTQASDRDNIKARQRAWATHKGLTLDPDGYCTCVDDNIFQGLSPGARKDFERGDGTELGKGGGRGKIQALHSSSALACNWFDYWRGRDLQPLSRALGVPVCFSTLALEQKFPTGLGGIGPNLDVLLWADETPFAIESKFTEPYTKSKAKTYLKPKYFHDGRSLWTEKGLPGCQAVAEALRRGQHDFNVLDVAQLLKHMLALAFRFGHQWSLSCLWFEVPGSLADQHRQELTVFTATAHIGTDAAHFSALTYQELFARMVPFVGQDDSEYIAYLQERYMSDALV
jgi:hypothetical protein